MSKCKNMAKYSAAAALLWAVTLNVHAEEYTIRRISLDEFSNRLPAISDTGRIIWQAYKLGVSDESSTIEVHIHVNGETRSLTITEGNAAASLEPRIRDDVITWSAGAVGLMVSEQNSILVNPHFPEDDPRHGVDFGAVSGDREIMVWRNDDTHRVTSDGYDDANPSADGNLVVWQRGRRWPFGWEIMLYDTVPMQFTQLTTNLFYDKGPRVHKGQVVWYGFDGANYQIQFYDHQTGDRRQITDSSYDNMVPIIEDGIIVWEGYPTLNADIYMWRAGETLKLGDNVDEDKNPRLWKGQVVWQGFDGDYFQIYHFDGTNTTQLTNTRYDNTHPDIRDGVITWMGFVDNFEPEIFVWTGGPDPVRLTNNDHHDQFPRTAGGRVVWEGRVDGVPHIFLAEPR